MPTRRDVMAGCVAAASAAACAPESAPDYLQAAQQTWRLDTTAADRQREWIRCATLAANGHNTQPWRFERGRDRIRIHPDLARRTPVVDPDDHHLWVSLGCAAENLAQAAAADGMAAEVHLDGAVLQLALVAAPARRSVLFEALPRRQSTRADYDGRPVAVAMLRQLEAAAADPAVQTRLIVDRSALDQITMLVLDGNTAQMANPAFVAELKAWIRFNEAEALASRDGLFSAASGNATAPRWLASPLFGLLFTAEAENKKYLQQMRSTAGVAVFAAEQPGAAGWVAVGRACQRFLLQATALGLRTAFVNQPVEVPALRAPLAAAAGLGARRPDLVVRFGHAPRLPQSLRRPVDAVLV